MSPEQLIAMLAALTPTQRRDLRWALWDVLTVQHPTDFEMERPDRADASEARQ